MHILQSFTGLPITLTAQGSWSAGATVVGGTAVIGVTAIAVGAVTVGEAGAGTTADTGTIEATLVPKHSLRPKDLS